MTTRDYLKQIIDEKRRRNPRISLRSIAAKMEIPSGRLSELLSGKRKLNEVHINKISKALKISSDDSKFLKQLLQSEKDQIEGTSYRRVYSEEQIEKLINWKPYAFMCFLQTSTYSNIEADLDKSEHIHFISKRINLPLNEVLELAQIMLDANLIVWKDSRFSPSHNVASVGYENIPSKVIQEAHRNTLDLAKEKLYSLDVTQRDFSFMTFAMDRRDFEKARKMIKVFRRRFTNSLEKKSNKPDVYQIAIQFFSISSID